MSEEISREEIAALLARGSEGMTKEEAIEIMQINRDGVANMSWSEDRTKTLAAFDMAIKALSQHRWIPVSEKLPEAGEEYLCCDACGFMHVGYLSKSLGEWFVNGEALEEVIAWMPLPEPYKAESEGAE